MASLRLFQCARSGTLSKGMGIWLPVTESHAQAFRYGGSPVKLGCFAPAYALRDRPYVDQPSSGKGEFIGRPYCLTTRCGLLGAEICGTPAPCPTR